MNSIVVIVITYNGMKWIERCLRSVFDSTIKADVIVIDNGSTDGTQEYIRSNFSDVDFIQSDDNLGFGAANNIGLKKALNIGYEYIYLLNQDAWVDCNTFRILIDKSKNNPDYGILSPLQINGKRELLDYNFYKNVLNREIVSDIMLTESYKDLYEVDFVMAAHWLLTRKCLLSVGGFSPIFMHYGEDDDYVFRTRRKGYKVGIDVTCLGVHDREYRPKHTKQQQRYFQRVLFLIKSAQYGVTNMGIFREFKECIKMSYAHRSLMPMENVWYMIRHKNKINKYVVDGATLDTPFL